MKFVACRVSSDRREGYWADGARGLSRKEAFRQGEHRISEGVRGDRGGGGYMGFSSSTTQSSRLKVARGEGRWEEISREGF